MAIVPVSALTNRHAAAPAAVAAATFVRARGRVPDPAPRRRPRPAEGGTVSGAVSRSNSKDRPPAANVAPAAPAPTPAPLPQSGVEPRTPGRRGHARRGDDGKWLPAGDYDVGFAKPPPETQFNSDSKRSPGRPKGSISQDALLKRTLEEKHTVRKDGKVRKMSARELAVKRVVLAALEGKDKDARKYVLTQAVRLFVAADERAAERTPAALNESDALSIKEYEAEMRASILRELGATSDHDQGED